MDWDKVNRQNLMRSRGTAVQLTDVLEKFIKREKRRHLKAKRAFEKLVKNPSPARKAELARASQRGWESYLKEQAAMQNKQCSSGDTRETMTRTQEE